MFFGIKNQLNSKLISTNTKISFYKTLIRPIALYGCEFWKLNKAEGLLLIFERKILRNTFGLQWKFIALDQIRWRNNPGL